MDHTALCTKQRIQFLDRNQKMTQHMLWRKFQQLPIRKSKTERKWVKKRLRKSITFEAPKSANLTIPSASTRTFPPFMSRCTIFFPCKYSSPRSNCRVYTLTNGSLNRPNLSSILQKNQIQEVQCKRERLFSEEKNNTQNYSWWSDKKP